MPYHIEYAKSGRSKCKGPKALCHQPDRTIQIGELRFGVDVEGPSFNSTTWKHWTCVTPKVIANMKEKMESPEEMEGFDSLRDEDAEKVRKAWENGEIPEEDRPKKTEENEETPKRGRAKAKETEAEEKPKKSRGTKRKNDDKQGEEEGGEEKPAAKKRGARARGRRKRKTSAKDEE